MVELCTEWLSYVFRMSKTESVAAEVDQLALPMSTTIFFVLYPTLKN